MNKESHRMSIYVDLKKMQKVKITTCTFAK